MNAVHMPTDRIQDVCTALLKIDALQDESTRTLYLDEAGTNLRRLLSVTRHPQARLDLYSILRACDREPGGMAALLAVIYSFHRGANAHAEAKRIIDEWIQSTLAARLGELLSEVAPSALTAMIALVSDGSAGLRSAGVQRGNLELIEAVGWDTSKWGAPAMLAVVECLSYEPLLTANLRQWSVDAAEELGINPTAVSGMRAAVALHRRSIETAIAAISPDNSDESEPDMRKTIIIEQTPSLVSHAVIRGGVPPRNQYFTGREPLLAEMEAALQSRQRAYMLPEALHGLGGVGKTQVAVEYTYRHSEEYQLIWWMAADEPSAVRSSLSALAGRLGLPVGPSMEQAVRAVLDALSTTPLQWLLVYDNADEIVDLENLIPAAGGHVIITSRNPEWASAGTSFEVDVFTRAESREMLRKRRPEIAEAEADRLAERLGDLPLALEQAVSFLITTLTSVDDYLGEFDRQSRVLLAEGRPRQYPTTVLTFVALALKRLRETGSVSPMLLELMAFLGPEPISTSLLWAGRGANVTEPLRSALRERIEIGRAVRDLGRLGLARVDGPSHRLQVHRLVQLILREELTDQRRQDARRNARRLLASANPGYPDNRETWPRHAEIAPHVRAAGLIDGDLDERRTALDQLRYVYNIGDYEGCRDLAEDILQAWARPVEEGGHPADDPLALLAIRRYADALRSLGDFPKAREQGLRARDAMLEALGEDHEYTLGAVMGVGADLRIAGDIAGARAIDERNLELHRRVLGEGDSGTLRAMMVVAIDRRMSGDSQGAYEIDVEAERLSKSMLGEGDTLMYYAISGQARDLYGLGRYGEALDLQQKFMQARTALLGPGHAHVLMSDSMIAIALRKTGQLAEAVARSHESYRNHSVRFGAKHAQTLAATMTYANALRAAGELQQARTLAVSAFEGYQNVYGIRHPLTSCSAVNLAITHRALGDDWEAKNLDEAALEIMRQTLHEEHPYLLCLLNNWTNDLARAHKLKEAQELSSRLLETSKRVRGDQHPYTLHCATNAALDLIAVGEESAGTTLMTSTVEALARIFGPDHPETGAARRRRRAECDIEPPPT